MRIMISLLGILTILAGVVPLLASFGVNFSFIPSGSAHQFIIIAVGGLGVIYGAFNSLIFGFEKFATVALGMLTLVGGVLPFVVSYIPVGVPTGGPIYAVMIILLGVVGLVYGFMALG